MDTNFARRCFACMVLGLATAASAQPGPPPPAAAIVSLTKALAGSWTTDEKYEPLFMTPKGGAGHGKQVFKAGPGGFTLTEEYRTQTPAGELFGFGLIWWDQWKSRQHMWCINS